MQRTALALIGCALVGWRVARRRWLLVRVAGSSMAPTLEEGDRVLVRRQQDGWTVGSVVVGRPPGHVEHELVVKRLVALEGDRAGELIVPPGHCWVIGDAPTSVDSRLWGPLPTTDLVGVVIGQTRVAKTAI